MPKNMNLLKQIRQGETAQRFHRRKKMAADFLTFFLETRVFAAPYRSSPDQAPSKEGPYYERKGDHMVFFKYADFTVRVIFDPNVKQGIHVSCNSSSTITSIPVKASPDGEWVAANGQDLADQVFQAVLSQFEAQFQAVETEILNRSGSAG